MPYRPIPPKPRKGKPRGINFDPKIYQRLLNLVASEHRNLSDTVNHFLALGFDAHDKAERDRIEGESIRRARERKARERR